jgi:hypothetical protein
MIHSRLKTLALSFTLALVAAGAADARGGGFSGGGFSGGGFSVSRLPTPVVRDHRGPSGGGGGVIVSNTPGRFGSTSRNPVIRDHRGSCDLGIRRPGGCAR